jgi:hypothetical protein
MFSPPVAPSRRIANDSSGVETNPDSGKNTRTPIAAYTSAAIRAKSREETPAAGFGRSLL